jgi:hypothetical protein
MHYIKQFYWHKRQNVRLQKRNSKFLQINRLLRNRKSARNKNGTISLRIISQLKEHDDNGDCNAHCK